MSEVNIPFLDLKTPHRELSSEILAAWKALLESAEFIGGVQVAEFEKAFAAFTGCRHCVGMNSGTDALRIALEAMELPRGGEVVTAANTFIATTEAITQAGGTPVLVDVDPITGTMDPERLRRAITPKTEVIVPVHLYGQPADLNPILELAREHKARVLEDAAQAHGAEYHGARAGSIGEAAAFSFYPGKNLGACGDAGAIVTNDAKVAATARMLGDHGQSKKYHHEMEGYNARLDALQAAALSIKLKHLDAWTEQRRAVAVRYREGLQGSGVAVPLEAAGRKHVYHLFVIRHPKRDAIRSDLLENGIQTGLHYPVPLHLQKPYRKMGLSRGSFPESERWAEHGLSLPMFPGLTDDQIGRVCEVIKNMRLEPAGYGDE